MINVENLRVTYTKDSSHYDALKGVSFKVNKGEIFTVMGLSGSGKSTLIRALIRLVPNIRGSIKCNNKDVLSLDKKGLIDYRRHDVAMVFQNYGLLPHLNVLDNVSFGLKIRKYTKKESRDLSLYYLELVGLKGWEDKRIDQLSGGMKQRVGIARALANQTPILLMDEPFSGLDPITRKSLQEELLNLKKTFNSTIVFVTHSPIEAERLSDRMIVINKGTILQEGTFSEISNNPADEYVDCLIHSERGGKIEI